MADRRQEDTVEDYKKRGINKITKMYENKYVEHLKRCLKPIIKPNLKILH
jgi:hypothetical protein